MASFVVLAARIPAPPYSEGTNCLKLAVWLGMLTYINWWKGSRGPIEKALIHPLEVQTIPAWQINVAKILFYLLLLTSVTVLNVRIVLTQGMYQNPGLIRKQCATHPYITSGYWLNIPHAWMLWSWVPLLCIVVLGIVCIAIWAYLFHVFTYDLEIDSNHLT